MPGRILVVDDLATNRIMMKVHLADAHYDVLQAAGGRAALDIARREAPDLILLDMMMPDLDGISVCERLRADPATAEIPIIIVTAATDARSRLRALAAGADDFLSRPLDELILLARVRSLLRARETAQELALRDGTERLLGFSEPAQGFAPPGRIALVAARAETAAGWQAALAGRLTDRIVPMTRAEALSPDPGHAVPDLFVIEGDLGGPGGGLRLLTELRSRSETRHAAVLIVLPPTARETAAMALDLGANDLMTAPLDGAELALRLKAQMARKRQADRLRDTLRDGLRMAATDPLTGLFNRRYALPHLARIAERADRTGRRFAVLLLDLDRFKAVNDRHGHAAGDAVLVAVAQRLRDNLRAVDLVARFGGEEFLVALPDTDATAACAAAERLRRVIGAAPVALPGGGDLQVSASIGVAMGGAEAGTVSALIEAADAALYRAKSAGRDRVDGPATD
ncbi:two-component system cell cycle response regulator [Rhodovulum iodosum]|uniref:diguanylate cyclase n=1 Tax=Rhodovulum iodosum TaxID=68291 RepID=A0ABV3XP95_9RHOB|nr:diguanylate cyclase [Rhodovulum robiginosum]RSK31552.1 diguanylate cyclase [Rhodovulum robiginosum]